MKRYSTNQVIIGDLNARHITWDSETNERGIAVTEVVKQTDLAYVLAAREPSYFKTIQKKGKPVQCKRNPDIAIVRTMDATAHIEAKDLGGGSQTTAP